MELYSERTNDPSAIPTKEMIIKMGLFGTGEIGYDAPLISLTQSESCKKNCNFSIALSTNGNLPNWTSRTLLHTAKKNKYTAFRQTISLLEYESLIELLAVFRRICEENNLTYMLYGGTLLGAYRHYGLVPWDDDIDVLVNSSDRPRFKHVLSRIPGYKLDDPPGRQWKFFKRFSNFQQDDNVGDGTDLKSIRNSLSFAQENVGSQLKQNISTNENWPYIDIFFFEENSTHIWDDNPSYSSTYCFEKFDVFPLKFMQFENFISPVPFDTKAFLSTTYNIDLCVTSTFSHKFETQSKQSQVSLPCRRLFKYFPFVFRYCVESFSFEQLVMDGGSVYEILLKC